jgi:hypothetical protein
MQILWLFIPLAFLVLVFRLIAGTFDHDRIDEYIAGQGGRIIDKQWSPFGNGWFGEKSARIYEVRYEDAGGCIHEATCKTNLFGGVYFTQDRIVSGLSRPAAPSREARLEQENRELRRQIEDLKRKREE